MIPEVAPYNNYTGDGSTTKFDFDFFIEDSTQLIVQLTQEDGTIQTLTNNTDYTIHEVGNKNGSYITFPITGSSYSALSSSEIISLSLSLPIAQESEYGTSSELDLVSLEYSFDYLTRICQIMNRQVVRALKVAEGSNINTDELALDVEKIADISDDVSTVAEIAADVTAVKNNATNITTVAGSISNVDAVGGSITNVNTVVTDLTNIDTVAGSISNVNTVGSDIANVNAVAGSISNVNTIKEDLTNIDNVADDLVNINAVAGSISNVDTVAAISSDVTAVKNNATNINAVAADLTNINAVAADLTNIDAASSNAQLAKDWANKMNGTVDGYEYSAKYYAQQAASGQVQANWNESDASSKAYIWNKPTIPDAQIQSDWSQSDNTKKDYIKNKPDLTTKQDTLVSGTNIKTINNNSILGSGNLTLDGLPSQTGQSGKFLTTDGTDASWVEVGTSRNIGEIVCSPLPQTDAGLHLLDGALIQGSGIYGEFVQHIADLYADNPTANYFAQDEDINFIQPKLTANGTLGGDSFAVSSTGTHASYPAWYAFDGDISNFTIAASAPPYSITMYNPIKLNVTKLTITNASTQAILTGSVEGSNDNTNWTSITSWTNSNTTGLDSWDIDLSSNTNYYNYYRLSIATAQSGGAIAEIKITATYSLTAEQSWQQSVNTYGVCGKFVYDSVNNTVRLPKYSNKIYTKGITSTAPVVGNGTVLGLQSSVGNYGLYAQSAGASTYGSLTNSSGLYGATVGTAFSGVRGGDVSLGVTTDPTKSGIIAQLSDITTSLDGYYYIVVATSTKTDIQVDIDEIATDLNGKADVDLTNVSNTSGFRKLAEIYNNGTSWYKVFNEYDLSTGNFIGQWCEQGGPIVQTGDAYVTITFLKPFTNTNYVIFKNQPFNNANPMSGYHASFFNFTNSTAQTRSYIGENAMWQANGYIS